jgi:hypothetical protein
MVDRGKSNSMSQPMPKLFLESSQGEHAAGSVIHRGAGNA